jgi:hypothetical protein
MLLFVGLFQLSEALFKLADALSHLGQVLHRSIHPLCFIGLDSRGPENGSPVRYIIGNAGLSTNGNHVSNLYMADQTGLPAEYAMMT